MDKYIPKYKPGHILYDNAHNQKFKILRINLDNGRLPWYTLQVMDNPFLYSSKYTSWSAKIADKKAICLNYSEAGKLLYGS